MDKHRVIQSIVAIGLLLALQVGFLVIEQEALGQGCGAACIPLDAIDSLPRTVFATDLIDADWFTVQDGDPSLSAPGDQGTGIDVFIPPSIPSSRMQVTISSEFADFKNFREGKDRIANPGGNDAYIVRSTLFVDYRVRERLAISMLATHIKKDQFTNRFGRRQAIGLGDIAAFGRYQLVKPCCHGDGPQIWLGFGVKFPTGSINEPTGSPRLPPPFQVGSGAHDVIPTLQYFQSFENFSLFGSYFSRMPIERNKNDYRFGQEHEVHFGIRRPVPAFCDKIQLSLSLDYLSAFHDSDFGMTLPARVRSGVLVLNTGGDFLDITPGVSFQITPKVIAQARFFLPIYQNWHGERSRNVGQVAPDFNTQITVSYLH